MTDQLYLAFFFAGFFIGFFWGAVIGIRSKRPQAAEIGMVPEGAPVVFSKSPAPDAVQDIQRFCETEGHPGCQELRGTIAGVYKDTRNALNIFLRPDRVYAGPGRILLLDIFDEPCVSFQAAPGYENRIIIPKPGTHVQVLAEGGNKVKAYFIGIIN